MLIDIPRPYNDYILGQNVKIREFDKFTATEEYVWHRDLEDRYVTVLEGLGWKFQFDNELPFLINKNDTLFIPKMTYHRIIPGITPLKIKIEEY